MADKNIPTRMCVGCREMKPKKELMRIVKSPEGELLLDFANGKISGRGAYLCPQQACLDKAVKTKAIARSLKCNISVELLAEIKEQLQAHVKD